MSAEKDIALLEIELARLRKLVFYDDLTGVLNRRGFDEEANRIFHTLYSVPHGPHERRTTRDIPFSIILLDLDNFKQVNDTFGHPAGDRALRAVADVIMKAVRHYDLVGRVGGEEFVIALPGAKAEIAEQVAERIRQGIEALQLSHREQDIKVTASLGIAMHTLEVGLADLIKAADEAMYRAKKSGKNRVVVFEPA